MNSFKERKELIESKIATLNHVKSFIDINLMARRKELKELEEGGKK